MRYDTEPANRARWEPNRYWKDDIRVESRAGDRVRRYGRSAITPGLTEIDLEDGRQVIVRQEMGIGVPLYTSIEVKSGDETIGIVSLTPDKNTSPTDPAYKATLDGKEIIMGACGQNLDLALADGLLGGAVSSEVYSALGYAPQRIYHDAGFITNVVQAMKPGYSEASFEPGLLQ